MKLCLWQIERAFPTIPKAYGFEAATQSPVPEIMEVWHEACCFSIDSDCFEHLLDGIASSGRSRVRRKAHPNSIG